MNNKLTKILDEASSIFIFGLTILFACIPLITIVDAFISAIDAMLDKGDDRLYRKFFKGMKRHFFPAFILEIIIGVVLVGFYLNGQFIFSLPIYLYIPIKGFLFGYVLICLSLVMHIMIGMAKKHKGRGLLLLSLKMFLNSFLKTLGLVACYSLVVVTIVIFPIVLPLAFCGVAKLHAYIGEIIWNDHSIIENNA